MGRKNEHRQMTILIAAALVIIVIGLFFLIKNYKSKNNWAVKDAPYPKLILKIESGKAWGRLNQPMQVLAGNGKIFVSDTGNSRILVFDSRGRYQYEFEKNIPKGKRRLRFPYGLAIDPSGLIYVADMELGKVLIFNQAGEFVREFNQDNRYINKPAGVFIQQNKVYISDIGSHKVHIFDRKGKLLMSLGSGHIGKEKDDLYYPNGVIADGTGRIYVSDSMNNRVQIFSPEGKYIETLDSDSGLGLQNPRGLALDKRGNIFVASALNKSIKAYDKDGIFLFDMSKDNNYALSLPIGLYIDRFQNIYVSDVGSNQILVFKE